MMKVLHLIHGLSMGGAETIVKDYALHMDKSRFEVVILCYEHLESPYEKILKRAGIRIIYAGDSLEKWKQRGLVGRAVRHFGLFFSIRKHIREEKPEVIHSHLRMNKYVWFAGVGQDTRIVHTVHSEPQIFWNGLGWKNRIDFWAAKRLVKKKHMRFIALHEDMRTEVNAMFGVKDTVVLNNGIDLTRFGQSFDKNQIKKGLKIREESFVIGHVGRFTKVKNQRFLVEIFAEIFKRDQNAFLLMVGDGEDRDCVKAELRKRKLDKNYRILSNRSDVAELMSAMDVFVFPSLFEGLAIVLIEAQAKGLPCVVSDRVSRAAAISNLVEFHSLDESATEWAKAICDTDQKIRPVYDRLEEWDIRNVTKKLESIYLGEL